MKRKNTRHSQQGSRRLPALFPLLALILLTAPLSTAWSRPNDFSEYAYWKKVGSQAAVQANQMLRNQVPQYNMTNCLALTNAGYAEVNNRATMGALDGLSNILRVSRGNHSLVELQSAPTAPLWFVVYDTVSGRAAYLEVDSSAVREKSLIQSSTLFSTAVTEQINAEHLYANATAYAEKFENKIFNGNEFRIVTIANALSAGVSTAAVRAFEFHDHYCPGVTSGVLLAEYIKKYFPANPGSKYFIQAVQPWCKEDALMVLLNATPGKKSYSVAYPSEEDIAAWPNWAKNVSTVAYRYDKESERWEGIALGYTWGETGCPDYGHSVMNKLCTDLWYLDQMGHPEQFVTILKRFNLPRGADPKEYARPGVDPVFLMDY
jgi:formylmethanofuran dehydrogenase subunit E-like metal-binding protein